MQDWLLRRQKEPAEMKEVSYGAILRMCLPLAEVLLMITRASKGYPIAQRAFASVHRGRKYRGG